MPTRTTSGTDDRRAPGAGRAGALPAAERALHVDGNLVTSRVGFARAFEEAVEDDDPSAMARAALGLGGVWVHEHRSAAEGAAVEARQLQALRRVPAASTLALRLRVRLAAEADYRAGCSHRSAHVLDEARRRGDPVALAEALSLTHHCLLGPEHATRRLAIADELIRVAATTGRPADTVMGLLWRAVDLFLLGDRQAERAAADLRAHEATARHAAASFTVDAMQVMLTLRAGRLAEAESLAERCAQAGAAAGDTDWMGWYTAQLLTVRWFQGRLGELVHTVATIVDSPTLSVVDHSFIGVQAAACAAAGKTREARSALARIVGRSLGDLPSSSSWLAAMTAVIEAAAMLDAPRAAEQAYRLLLPYADLPVMGSLAVACLGSARHPLGVACLVLGDPDRAVQHLEAAVEHNAGLGHWPAATLSRHRLAQALLQRGRSGDAQAAGRLRAEAAADAAELGMALPQGRPARPAVPAACTRRGRRWRVELHGRAAVVDDMVGLHHLATLVANPGVDIPAIALTGPATGGVPSSVAPQRVLDAEAVRQYRTRLRDLATETARAERTGHPDELATLRAEADWLRRELATASGLAGRPRTFADDAERARIAVGKAIRRALDRLADVDAAMAAELRDSVETGMTCCYRPADP